MLLLTIVIIWLILNPMFRPSLQHDYLYPAWNSTWGLSFVDFLAACIIVLSLEYRSITFRALNLQPLRWLGQISYGAYVFHDIPHPMYVRFARHYLVHWRIGTAGIAFAGTLLLAWASFRWFESRFIRLKSAWSR